MLVQRCDQQSMSTFRLFSPIAVRANANLSLRGEQARYVGRVLRMKPGDELTVFDGNGGEFPATIDVVTKQELKLVIGAHVARNAESPLRITLVQGISRGERMDFVVQKATELGVRRITPVLTEYGVVKLAGERAQKRRDHWQGVAASACEQSGRTRPPRIDPPVSLNQWFGDKPADADVDLILHPGAATPLSRVGPPTTGACLLIGPEGGFSESEYADAKIAGFNAVSLGPRILRTETAAAAALAVMQSNWGDLRR